MSESKFHGILQNHKEEVEPGRRGPGRPGGQGKRVNPDFTQVTAYIPAALHTQTKINLLRQPEKLEFSELVANLLVEWNQKQQ